MNKEENKIKFKDFPQALKDRVLEIRTEQYYEGNNRDLDRHSLAMLFKFNLTSEGREYWTNLYNTNNFSAFEEKKKTVTKLKNKVIKRATNSKILEVEDTDGSVYAIGDTIRIFEKTCASHSQIYKILGFRWNNDKTHICAITSKHNNGIRLDWIEHYVEKPKFILPEKWCVRNVNNIIADYFNNKVDSIFKIYNHKIHFNRFLHSEDNRNNNVLKHQKIQASIAYSYIKPNFTEITFEQFKQYILFDGYKVGDKINTLSGKNDIIQDANKNRKNKNFQKSKMFESLKELANTKING